MDICVNVRYVNPMFARHTPYQSKQKKQKPKPTPAKKKAPRPRPMRSRVVSAQKSRVRRSRVQTLEGLGTALGSFALDIIKKVMPFIRTPRALLSIAGACPTAREEVKRLLLGSQESFDHVLRMIYMWRPHKRPARVEAVMRLYVEGKIFQPCPLRLLRLELATRCEIADTHAHIHLTTM